MLVQLKAGSVVVVDDDAPTEVLSTRRRWYFDRRTGNVTVGKRFVARLIVGVLKRGESVRYLDGDPRNLQRANLYIVPRSHALLGTKRKRRPGKSKYRGVSWRSKEGAWYAGVTVTIDGRRIRKNIGPFSNERAAARAWDAYVSELIPGFTRLNFP